VPYRRLAVGRRRISSRGCGVATRDTCLRPAEPGRQAAATVSAALPRRLLTCCRHLADRPDRSGHSQTVLPAGCRKHPLLTLPSVAAEVHSRQGGEAARAGWPTGCKTAGLGCSVAIKMRATPLRALVAWRAHNR